MCVVNDLPLHDFLGNIFLDALHELKVVSVRNGEANLLIYVMLTGSIV